MHIHIRCLFVLFAAVSIPAMVHAQERPAVPYERRIDVFWTDRPPVLDGKMDDACWKEAGVAGDFRRLENAAEAAIPQSEVRVCYDAEYLYLFYRLPDAEMDKLKVGAPDDARDVMDFGKDVVELFLDPGRTRSAYFHFCTTPLGARYDARITPEKRREVGVYTPDWEAVPRLDRDHWAVELRIPFSELAFDGGAIGTPRPGEEWGVNFCRDQGYRKEWTFWSPTRSKSFHRPAEIGVAVFRGRKDGGALPSLRWESSALAFGPGRLALAADGAGAGLVAEWRVLRDRAPASAAGAPSAARPLELPYRIDAGGRWDARVTVRQKGRAVFSGRTIAELPRVEALVADVAGRVRAGLEAVGREGGAPSVAALRADLLRLEAMAAPLADRLRTPSALSRAEWAEIVARMPAVEAAWTPLAYDIRTLALHPAVAAGPGRFGAAAAGAYDRVFPETVVPPRSGPVGIAAAGGERESFQIALMPFRQDVAGISVSCAGLTGDAGTLPASCVEFDTVDFVGMSEAWGGGRTPDALRPGPPTTLRKNETRLVWVTVLVPRGTKRGVYRGEVVVAAGAWNAFVPLEVRAYGFDIPERRSVSTDPWYWIDGGRNARAYYKAKEYPFTPELYEKHLKLLARYRYAAYPLSSDVMWQMLKMYREKDGGLTFDFSGWDWVFDLGRKYGADNVGASFGCNLNALRPSFSSRLPIFDRETGARVSTPAAHAKAVAAWTYAAGETKKSDLAANPVYRQFMVQLVEYLRKKGLLGNAHYEIYDEPKTGNEWQDVLLMHGFLKRLVPDLKLKSYGVGPWHYEDRPEWSPIGSYDAWAPGLYTITPERLKQLHDRQAKGEVFWFYTCNAGYRDTDRATKPHICLYQHPLAPRMHGWAAWKLKADGFLIFALAEGMPTNTQADPERFYTDPVWETDRTAGQGYLLYPGPDGEFWPSVRLAAVRDGLEDYELFKLLADRRAKLDPKKDAALAARIDAALEIGDDILPWDWWAWTTDETRLRARRDRLADLILESTR